MATDLTHSHCQALKPKDKPYREFDTRVTGLNLQVSPAGTKIWNLAYRHNAARRFHKMGTFPATSVSDARKRALEVRGEIEAGNPPSRRQDQIPFATTNQLLDDYLGDCATRGVKSLNDIRNYFETNVRPVIGKTLAHEVGPRDIHQIINAIIERGSVTMAARVRSALRSAFHYGQKAEFDPHRAMTRTYSIKFNPCDAVDKPRGSANARTRVLTLAEIGQIWREIPACGAPETSFAVRALLASGGCRVQEVTKLRWDWINFDQATIALPADETKTGVSRIHPVGRHLRSVLEFMRQISGHAEVVFPSPHAIAQPIDFDSVANVTRKLRVKSAMQTWVPSDTRRSCATHLGDAGASVENIAHLLGHTINHVTQRHYEQSSRLAEKRKLVETWDGLLDKAIGK